MHLSDLLIANPGADRDAAPAHATGERAHVVALAPRPVLHGNGAGAAVAVKGRAEHADGGVAFAHAGAAVHKVKAIRVQLVGGCAELGLGVCVAQGRRQVGRLVLGGV